jgi:hypothetical protein
VSPIGSDAWRQNVFQRNICGNNGNCSRICVSMRHPK